MRTLSVEATTQVRSAIADASRRTGIDFHYLLGQAQVESGLRADARAATSSASGLYQFIEQSWLGVVKAHGAEHGLGWAADAIQRGPGGRYGVADPATRQAILALRNDPAAAARMAAEHAADNKAALEARLGRPATGTDLYMAHFLGQGAAARFLDAMAATPDRAAAPLFPAAARANRAIFYAADGGPRSLADIYARFARKLDRGAAATTPDAPGAPAPGGQGDAAFAGAFEVVLGNDAAGGDRHWIETTLAQLGGAGPARLDPLRPTPESARLAYLMLAGLGGSAA